VSTYVTWKPVSNGTLLMSIISSFYCTTLVLNVGRGLH